MAGSAIVRYLPPIVHSAAATQERPARTQVVRAATLVAGLTFAVMIGSFYLAGQYLQRVARYSALEAASVLAVVALLVGVAAPFAGRLVDRHGERLSAQLGFLIAGAGLGASQFPPCRWTAPQPSRC
jgi:MFS family permease